MDKYTPKSRIELKILVQDENIYLGDIDTSNITDMSLLFRGITRNDFSGIESWDTSNVTDMRGMFGNASYFNHNINSWDTSKVTDMEYMFHGAERFNQPLDSWDTSNVVNMNGMFCGAKSFNQPLDSWDTSKVVDMGSMFLQARLFNQPLNSWNTSNVVSMYCMFCAADKFNQPLDNWDTSGVEIMTDMFLNAVSFKQNINSWDVSSVRDNQAMFAGSGMRRMPKWYKHTPFFNLDSDDIGAEIERLVKEAIANPRPKKPKIPQRTTNKLNYDWKTLSLTSKIFSIFAICIVVIACFDGIKSILKDNDTKSQPTQTQTTKPKQTQSAKQPAQNVLRCDNKDLLNHLIKSYKNFVVEVYQDAEIFAKWQESYRQAGISLASAEELVNRFKYNITKVQTKSSDEVNKQVICEVEIEEVQPNGKFYSVLDYRAQLTDNNGIEFNILDVRGLDK